MQKTLLLLAGLALLARPAFGATVPCSYLIEAGDDLYTLAQRWGLNDTELAKLNNINDAEQTIYEGEVLSVPCDPKEDVNDASNLYNLLARRSDMTVLFQALASVGALDQFKDGSTKATLFAPTNDAFLALLSQLKLTPAQLLNDTELVTDVLNYHIIPGPKKYSDDFKNGRSYKTMLAGKRLKIEKSGDNITVVTVAGQDVPVAVADLTAGDAVVHIINEVLLPIGGDAPAAAPAKPTKPMTPTTNPEAPSPAALPADCSYIVKAGDSLFSIAQSFGVSLESVVKKNAQIQDPELIQPGDKIKVC